LYSSRGVGLSSAAALILEHSADSRLDCNTLLASLFKVLK